MSDPVRVFLSAPLSTPEQREFNEVVTERIERYCRVFLPQRDCGLLTEMCNYMSRYEAERRIVEKDLEELHDADIVVAVLDVPIVSGGVAMELGYAFAMGKLCVGLEPPGVRDRRVMRNPMIDCTLAQRFDKIDALLVWLRRSLFAAHAPGRRNSAGNGQLRPGVTVWQP